jgi:hypothetical protein
MTVPCTSIPLRSLITVGGYTASIFDHPCEVHEILCHERRVPVGEIVFRST